MRTFTVGLGGAYDRSRTDAVAAGKGASTELRSAYLGTGDQVHDVRTLQEHEALLQQYDCAVLPKPFDLDVLLAKVKAALARYPRN